MSKLKDPAFLFYPEAFIVGTIDMTDEEVGRYIRLLCRQFTKGHLKDLPGASEQVMEKFIQDQDGRWYNERLEYEMEKRRKYAESRRRNGSKGGRPKEPSGNHTESTEEPHGNHMVQKIEPYANHTTNTNTNTNRNTDTNTNLSTMRRRIQRTKERYGL